MKYLKRFNESENIKADIHGLKCDKPGCNWNDMSVPYTDYEKSIDKPCPDCGSNLLTQSDYDQVLKMVQAVEMINMYSAEDLEEIAKNLTEEEIDGALDTMNQLKMKKTGEDENGERWQVG